MKKLLITLLFLFLYAEDKVLKETKVKMDDNPLKKKTFISKTNLNVKNIPRSVNIIDNSIIKDTSSQNLRDVLDYIPGVSVPDTTDKEIMMRGEFVPNNNILIDGLRVFQGGSSGTTSRFPSTFDIDSVEILTGPSSSTYGFGSPFGIININTKKPQKDPFTKIYYGYKSFLAKDVGYFKRNSFDIGVDTTGPIANNKNLLYRLTAKVEPYKQKFQKNRKEKNFYFSGAITSILSDKLSIIQKIKYNKEKRTSGTSHGDGVITEKGNMNKMINNDRSLYYGGEKDYGKVSMMSYSALIQYLLSNDWSIDSRLSYKKEKINNSDLYIQSNFKRYIKNDKEYIARRHVKSDAKQNFKNLDVTIKGKQKFKWLVNNSIFGINYNTSNRSYGRYFETYDSKNKKNTSIQQTNPNKNNYIEIGNPNNAAENTQIDGDVKLTDTKIINETFFLSDYIQINKFILYLDYSINKQTKTEKAKKESFKGNSKAIGLTYNLNDDLSLYTSFSWGIEPVYSGDKTKIDGSTKYKPKELLNKEIGTKFMKDDYWLSFTLFQMNKYNGTRYERIKGVTYLEQDKDSSYISKGIETKFYFSYNDIYANTLAYTYTNAYYKKSESHNDKDRKRNVSTHMFSSFSKLTLNSKTSIHLGLIYESPKYNVDQRINSRRKATKLKRRFQIDTGLNYKYSKSLDVNLNIKNLLDDKRIDGGYYELHAKPADPRSISLNVIQTF